jgi:hypothetical protein
VTLPIFQSSRLARTIDAYEPDIDTQIRVEQEIQQALENSPSIWSDKVSLRAREAWESRLWTNIERHRHFRLRDQDDLVSERPGRKLHIVQFIRKLNSLPRRRWILNPYSIRGMRGLSVSRGGGKPQYVMALDDGIFPEWSQIELDDHGLIKRLKSRGWRATLLTLLDQSLITEHEIQHLFGFASGVSGAIFRRCVYEHRNRCFADGEEWLERRRVRPDERYQ